MYNIFKFFIIENTCRDITCDRISVQTDSGRHEQKHGQQPQIQPWCRAPIHGTRRSKHQAQPREVSIKSCSLETLIKTDFNIDWEGGFSLFFHTDHYHSRVTSEKDVFFLREQL